MKQYMDFGIPEGGHHEAEDLVIVIDGSSSMRTKDYSPSRLKAAKTAGSALVDVKAQVAPGDRVAVVVFGSNARVFLPLTELQDGRQTIKKALGKIRISGCTNISAGLRLACGVLGGDASQLESRGVFAWLKKSVFEVPKISSDRSDRTAGQAPARRILLLSDGEYNEGGNPVPIAAALKHQGIVIDVIGIAASPTAQGFCEPDLRRIASSPGDGREHYCFIGNTQALVKKFESLAFRIRPLEV